MTDKLDAIVKRARECMEDAAKADQLNREGGLDDARFIAGRQWSEEEETARNGRPTITINQLAPAYRQVTGDLRRTNPAINVMAADGDAKEEVAEVIEGLVRHIEQASDAQSVYEGAAETAAAARIGNFRVLADYCDDVSFDQELRIERVWGAYSVYWDPNARLSTRADAQWVLITQDMSVKEFEAAYPKARKVDAAYDGKTDLLHNWRREGKVVVAEYFWREADPVTISLMPDGSVVEGKKDGALRTRESKRERVMWAKVNGQDVLEGPQAFPCKYLPVVAVTGEEIDLGGEVARSGVATHAKDPQRVLNYWSSTSMEMIAQQPKAPWLVQPEHVAGLEDYWRRANNDNLPYLPYNPATDGSMPQRSMPPTPSPAVLTEIARATEDIRSTTGIHSAALGARSNETSGRAINARQQESDLSTSIYSDNMAKAVAQCGRILVDMIPRIYDTPRTVRIVGKDDVEKMVKVNARAFDPMSGPVDVNKLTVGKYDVRVSVGPNYSTKRQQVAESMNAFVQAFPAAFPLVADLVAKNQDWPDADLFAERFKAMLPPGARKPEDMSPEEQQQAQAAMQQQAQQAQMQQAMQQATIQKTVAEAQEKQARAAVAGVEAQAALNAPQGSPEAPQDPRMAEAELRQALATIAETLANVGLIHAKTKETEAKALHSTVQALTPPPPPSAPASGKPQPAR